MPTDTATPEDLANGILAAARHIAEQEVFKLIEQRIIPNEARIKALEDQLASLRR